MTSVTASHQGRRSVAVIDPPSAGIGWRRAVVMVVSLAVSAALIAALLHRADPSAMLAAAGRASPVALLAAVSLNIPCTLLRAWRGQLLVGHLGGRVPLGRMTTIQLAGQALSSVTPAATGDLVRPYIWRRTDSVPVRDGVSVVLYERIVSFVLLLAAGALTGAFLLSSVASVVPIAIGGLLILVVLAGATAALRRRPPQGWSRLPQRMRAIGSRLGELISSPGVAARFTAVTLVVFLLSGVQIVILTAAVDSPVPLWVGVAAYCLSQAAGSASSLPFGIGVTDAVVVALLIAAGVDAPAATATMVLSRFVVTLPLGIAGAATYLVLGRLWARSAT